MHTKLSGRVTGTNDVPGRPKYFSPCRGAQWWLPKDMPALAPVSVTLFGKGSGSRDDISWIIGADPKSDDNVLIREEPEEKIRLRQKRGTQGRESGEDGSRDWRMCPRTHEHLEPQKLEETRRSLPGPSLEGYPRSLNCWAPEL